MIPQSQNVVPVNTEAYEIAPTKTYRIDYINKRIIGMIDGRDAVMQYIRKALNTDKYAYEIYDWYYGNELYKLVGHSYDYVVTRIPNILREALLVDSRIIDIRDFAFRKTKLDEIVVSCVIDTVYGQIKYEQEVLI